MSDDRLFSDVPVLPQPAYAGFPSPGDDYADPVAFTHGFRLAMLACAALFAAGGVISWITIRNDVLEP